MVRTKYFAVLALATLSTLPGQITGVRIYTDPTGPFFYVDGQQFSAPVTQLWPPGSKHSLSVAPMGNAYKTTYAPSQWVTNKGTLSVGACPPIAVTADPDLTFVKCDIKTSYAVTLSYYSCSEGSTCRSPATIYINHKPYTQDTEVYFDAGSTIQIEAYPNDGWVFTGWGQLPGTGQPTNAFVRTFVLDQPQVVRPTFQSASNLRVNFDSSPTGLVLLMDRTPMTAPFFLDWGWNTVHSVGTLPSQRDNNGHLMIFDSWSDGGAINHDYKMPASGPVGVNLTAKFVPGASVTFLTDPPGLTLTVDGRSNWQNYTFAWPAGSTHSVEAAPQVVDAQGRKYKFSSWSNGGAASQQITVATAPDEVRYTATYTPVAQVSVNSTPSGLKLQIDGADCLTPCSVERSVGAAVRVSAPAMLQTADGSRLVFQGWGDSSATDRSLTASANPLNLTAAYNSQYRLSLAADPPEGVTWRVAPDSPDGYYDAQTAVAVAADAQPGYKFLGWSGDLGAAAAKQASVMMSAPKTVIALLDRIPFVAPGSVKNAAGDTPDNVVAPGSVISISGVNLAPSMVASPATALKQILNGVTVWLGDQLAPLFFVSPDQINAQLPSSVAEGDQVLSIRWEGKPDAKVNFTVARNAPGLFTQSIAGVSYALAAHADSSLVTPDSPAVQGETITIFGTGFGPYLGGTADGFALAEAPNLILVDPVTVVSGDTVLTPDYAGIAAGRVGVQAVRVLVTDSLPTGANAPVKIVSGGRESNTAMLPMR